MAILHYKDDSIVPNFDLNVKEYAIGGKLLTMRMTFNEYDSTVLTKEQIKEKMAINLAQAMVENNMIEFTRQVDHSTLNVMIHARCYMAPNEQVKILRIHEASINHR
jgi:hypothetical protein